MNGKICLEGTMHHSHQAIQRTRHYEAGISIEMDSSDIIQVCVDGFNTLSCIVIGVS